MICPFCLNSWPSVSSPTALPPRSSDRRCSLCLWRAGGRVAPWQQRCEAVPGFHAISSVANCSHSFAFPSDLPLCPVFLMWFALRSGRGKGSMWIIAVFSLTYHAKAAPWCRGCRELQAMHRGDVWMFIALIERQKSPSPIPSRDPPHLLCLLQSCTIRNPKLTPKSMRTGSSIRLERTWQCEQSDNAWNKATIARWEGLWVHPQQGKGLISLCFPFLLCALTGLSKLLSWSLPEMLLRQLVKLLGNFSCHLSPSFA